MPRSAQAVEPLEEKKLEDAVTAFRRVAARALKGRVPNQRVLANRLAMPETTLSSALRGQRFTFETWPQICAGLDLDPVEALVEGQALLRQDQDRAREVAYRKMLEAAECDTMIALSGQLSSEEKARIVAALSQEEEGSES